jgi:hypothetical protein
VVKIVLGSDERKGRQMTKIVLKVKKDVSGQEAEALRFVIKRALADYYSKHVPVEKNVNPGLKVRNPKQWHEKMAEIEQNIHACFLLMMIKTDDIEVKVTP